MIVAARAVHFGAAMLLFGELLFGLTVASSNPVATGPSSFRPRFAGWVLAASIVSGFAWLAADAGRMSGLPLAEALDARNVAVVVTGTAFGRLWAWRFVCTVALASTFVSMARTDRARSSRRVAIAALVLAAADLVSLAWSGHAAASGRELPLASDVVHLLAAGAWVGALPALVVALGPATSAASGIRTARRFTILGVCSVGALVASGIGNAWVLVGDPTALTGTSYGRLLLAKLVVFAAMVAIAAINRASVRRPLDADEDAQRRALRALRRNATIEIVLGAIVVAIVGALGEMMPAADQAMGR